MKKAFHLVTIFAIIFLTNCTSKSIIQSPINDLVRDQDHTLYHIDFVNGQLINDQTKQPVNVSGEFLEIQGWAIDIDSKSAPETIYFQIGEKQFENTLITKRQDVANTLQMQKAVNVGYSFKIPKKNLGQGVLETKLIVVKGGNKEYYAPNPSKTLLLNILDK